MEATNGNNLVLFGYESNSSVKQLFLFMKLCSIGEHFVIFLLSYGELAAAEDDKVSEMEFQEIVVKAKKVAAEVKE